MTVPTPGPPIERAQLCSVTRFEHPNNGVGLPRRLGPCEKPYGHTGPHLAQGVGWFDHAERAAPTGAGQQLLVTNGQQLTVDAMLTAPAALHHHLQALGFDVSTAAPLTRREKLRRAVDDRLSNARTWLAVRIAPWLNNEEE